MFPQSSSSVVLMNLLVGKRSSVEPQRVSANVALGSQCCIRASLYNRGQNCKTYDLWFLVLSRMDVDSLSLSLLLSPPPSLCLCLCLSLSVSVCLCLSVCLSFSNSCHDVARYYVKTCCSLPFVQTVLSPPKACNYIP